MFTENELQTILTCRKEGGDIWNNEIIKDIKRKIKIYYLNKNNYECCYCRKNLYGEFNMVIDIEHILPQKKFPEYMFEPDNLNVACKRCNMNVKGDNTDFIVNDSNISSNYKVSSKYHFIHPNFDKYFEHMDYSVIIKNQIKIIKYTPLSEKGKYTYRYFSLQKLEIENFNNAQGIEIKKTELSEAIPESIKENVKKFLRDI